jgi:hypothetical protein
MPNVDGAMATCRKSVQQLSRGACGRLYRSNAMNKVSLNAEGPFGFWKHSGLESVLSVELACNGGVYLWTVEQGRGVLIYYIGRAKSFGQRLSQHLDYYLSGKYEVDRATQFVIGKVEKLYEIKNDNKFGDRTEFMERRNELRSEIDNMLAAFRIFLIPIEDTRLRCRLESQLITLMRPRLEDKVNKDNFFANLRCETGRLSGEESVHVLIGSSMNIIGLPREIEV